MHSMLGFNSEFCIPLAETLLHFLWQGSLIAALALGAGALLRRAPAQVRYWLYVVALAVMAACPAATFLMLASPRGGALDGNVEAKRMIVMEKSAAAFKGASTNVRRPASDAHMPSPRQPAPMMALPQPPATDAPYRGFTAWAATIDWQRLAPLIVAGYLAGVMLMLGRLLLAVRGGSELRKRACAVHDPEILRVLARAAKALHLRAAPALAWCGQVGVPTVVGLLKPTILLPLTLASGLTPGQVELLLLHELAHLRRQDHWVNVAQWAVETVLFFHPAVWLVSWRIRVERELSCDDMVIATGVERDSYADSLLRMAEISKSFNQAGPAPAMALGADGRRSKFGERILCLIEGPKHESLRVRRAWPLAFLFLGLGVLLAANLNGNDIKNASQAGLVDKTAGKPTSPETRKVDLPVRNQAGKPVAEAEVVLIQHVRGDDKDQTTPFGPVLTDARGIASFTGIPVLPKYALAAYARVPNKLIGVANEHYPPRARIKPRPFEVTMVPSTSIGGTVTAPAGYDLSRITVRVIDFNIRDGKGSFGSGAYGDDLERLAWVGKTGLDKNGHYTLRDLPQDGTIYLAAEGPGLGQGQVMSGKENGPTDFNMALGPEGVIEGDVRDANGKPVAGGSVQGMPYGGGVTLPFISATDESGHYVLKGLRPEKYTVQATAPKRLGELNAAPVENVYIKAGQRVTGINFKLSPGALVHGTVKDAKTGKPLAKAEVNALSPGMGGVSVGMVATDRDGRYTLRVPEGTVHLYIMVCPEGYTYPKDSHGVRAPTQENGRQVTARNGEEIRTGVDFVLDPQGPADKIRTTRAQGQVLDHDGKPLKGIQVMSDVKYPDGRRIMGENLGKTDAAGGYAVDVIVGGKYRLFAGGGDWGFEFSKEFTANDKTVQKVEDLKLARATTFLEGRVLDIDGRPVLDARVQVSSRHNWHREKTTDAEGRFRIEKLVDETLAVFVVQSGRQALTQSDLAPGRKDGNFIYPGLPWEKKLTADEAARLAATAANLECEKRYQKRPFTPQHYTAMPDRNRHWTWGRLDQPGNEGFAAEVLFYDSGSALKVNLKAPGGAAGSAPTGQVQGAEPILLLGMKVVPLTPELKKQYRLAADEGVVVLDPGENVERLGIGKVEAGDCFFMVGEKKIRDIQEMVGEVLRIQQKYVPFQSKQTVEGNRGRVRVVYEHGPRGKSETLAQYLKLSDGDEQGLMALAINLGLEVAFFPQTAAEPNSSKVQGTVRDVQGQPLAHALIQIREKGKPGQRRIQMQDVNTDRQGHYQYGRVTWPYTVGSLVYEPFDLGRSARFQYAHRREVFNGNKTVDFKFDPFPTGGAGFSGRVLDENGAVVKAYTLTMEKEKRDQPMDPEKDYDTFGYRLQVSLDDGRFSLSGLPAGKYSVTVAPEGRARIYEYLKSQSFDLKDGANEQTIKLTRRKNSELERFLNPEMAPSNNAIPAEPGSGDNEISGRVIDANG